MTKEFLSNELVRNNAIKLAHRIMEEGFIPDVIYVSLRGGAYMGNVMSEYFKVYRKNERPIYYAAVTARSYSGVRESSKVMVDGWTYDPKYLRNGDKVLLIDDIFDSGRTINRLAEIIMEHGIPREDLKIAVHDYKVINYHEEQPRLPIQPDYYCRKHVLETPEDEVWIHYLSHELVAMSPEELEKYYFSTDPELKKALDLKLFS